MNKSIRRQDAGGILGLFHNGRHVDTVPTGDAWGAATRAVTARRLGCPESALEVLVACGVHPDAAAVDCTRCEPAGDDE